MCLAANYPDACEQIIDLLKTNGRDVDPLLLQELQIYRAKVQAASSEDESESESSETVPDPLQSMQSKLVHDNEENEMNAEIAEDAPILAPAEEESYAGFSPSAIESLQLSDEIDDDELVQHDEENMTETGVEM